jgi:hypothetical protein
MKVQPEQIQAALRDLRDRHARQPTAASAFDLARLCYLCGEYDEALQRFAEARDLAPAEPACALALARAASALGEYAVEADALARALRDCPPDPGIALHHALHDVPGDRAAAIARLALFPADPACVEFARALRRIEAGLPVQADSDEPRAIARAASARWVQRHGGAAGRFQGLPVAVLERALEAARVPGLVLEFGVYHGRSLRILAARGAGPVHGFDSFEGLPEAWNAAEGPGAYSTGGRRPRVDGATLHAGWFEDTLPAFLATHSGAVSLLHVDCDLYSSTRTVLQALAPRLVAGSVILFDDLLGYPGFEAHELRAFDEYLAASGRRYELVAAALLGREVAVRLTD